MGRERRTSLTSSGLRYMYMRAALDLCKLSYTRVCMCTGPLFMRLVSEKAMAQSWTTAWGLGTPAIKETTLPPSGDKVPVYTVDMRMRF